MQKHINITTTNKKTIFGILGTPQGKSKGLIVFMHGLLSNQDEGVIAYGAKYLIKKGYTTYRFNFYGDKKNARKFETTNLKDHITDNNKIIEYFTKKGYKNIILIGHSFGGLTILYSKIKHIKNIVMRDSSIGGKALLSDVIYDKKNKKHMIDRGGEIKFPIGASMYKDFLISPKINIEKIKKIKIPIKIICAEHGLKIPGKKYYNAANNPKDYVIIPGASHCFEEKGAKEKLLQESYQRIKKYL